MVMYDGIYYLNNKGSRWIYYENNKKIKVRILKDKTQNIKEELIRTAIFFESFGNFAIVCVSINGKKRKLINYELINKGE